MLTMRSNSLKWRGYEAVARPAPLTLTRLRLVVANPIIFTPEELATEEWKTLDWAIGFKFSNLGRIISPTGRIVSNKKPPPGARGYLTVNITKNGQRKSYKNHRLIMEAFKGASELHVDHLNGIKHDNRLSNLQYVSNQENRIRFHHIKRGRIGIYYEKRRDKYIARFTNPLNGKRYQKQYDTAEEAQNAYNAQMASYRALFADGADKSAGGE